jgi:hypothetical protein
MKFISLYFKLIFLFFNNLMDFVKKLKIFQYLNFDFQTNYEHTNLKAFFIIYIYINYNFKK